MDNGLQCTLEMQDCTCEAMKTVKSLLRATIWHSQLGDFMGLDNLDFGPLVLWPDLCQQEH